MRVEGEGMRSHGIHSGDLLVIDRSVVPRPGSLLVAVHHGGFILRQLGWQGGQPVLLPATPGEHPIPMDLENGDATGLFGVVVHAVHHLANAPSRRR
jgi:DNA polymerase V